MKRRDETGQLARAFEEMVRRLNGQESDLRKNAAELERFKALMDQSNDGFYVIDPENSRFIDANRSAWEILGYSREELLLRGVMDIRAEHLSPDAWRATVREVAQTDHKTFETQHRRRDGSVMDVEISWGFHKVGDDAFIIAVSRDVTARKQAERELLEARNFLDSVVEALPIMVFVKKADDLTFVRFNKAGEELLGLSQEEMIGKSDYDIFPREEADAFVEKDREVLAGREILDLPEETIQTRNGERALHTRKTVIRDAEGKPRFLLGVSEDVTEHKQMERALALVNEKLLKANLHLEERVRERTGELETVNRSLQEEVERRREAQERLILSHEVIRNTSEAVVITEPDGAILEVNDAYCAITGYHRSEVLGQNPRILKSDRHDETFYQEMWEAITGAGHWKGEVWDRRKTGEVFPKWLTINAVRNDRGKIVKYVGIFSDISDRKAAEAELERMARFDALTELPNRVLFQDRLEQHIAIAGKNRGSFALMFLDLDNFKDVNDSLGHFAGDTLLQEAARRLQTGVSDYDAVFQSEGVSTVARMGGDEFTIILAHCPNAECAADAARRILESLGEPMELEGHQVFVQASIGLAVYPQDGDAADALIKNADAAMYSAKAAGRNDFHFFTPEMNQRAHRRIRLEGRMRQALTDERFELFYQPKISTRNGRISGMEALVRWRDPERGLISPADFIPVAEEVGLIVPLGEWILEQACRQARLWMADGLPNLKMAVNLSTRQFADPRLLSMIENALNASGLPPENLELEITESMMMGDVTKAEETMGGIRALGIAIAIDDFGTGYSSLAYLKGFPIQTLKIDQSFVRDLEVDSDDAAIVSTIIAMADKLRLNVVAEGVETEEQAAFLREQGCRELQGYLFSKPLPADAFSRLLRGDAEEEGA